MENLFNDKISYYFPNQGITNSKTQVYNEYLHDAYKQVFNILEKYKLDYYVFAGSSIGYVRNKSNIPWADDYDIIIFEKEKEKFENDIIPILKKNGYIIGLPHEVRPDLYPSHAGWQIGGKRINDTTFFLFDVFLTRVDEEGYIRNTGNFGDYNSKNISIDKVNPKKYVMFDGLYLPFFNNVEEEVKLTYGDVINKVVIYVAHSSLGRITINEHWEKVYEEFNKFKDKAIQNTKKQIFKNKQYIGDKKLTIRCNNNNLKYDEISILEYINKNNIGILYIEDEDFLKYCCVVKFYYPNIMINYYMYDYINVKNIFNLNYVSNVYCSNQNLLNQIDDQDIIYNEKPNFKIIKVITFGTYDLFHVGHNNLFKRCKEYGETLVVGVSTDELNLQKGKKSIYNLDKRLDDVKYNIYVDSIFIEESLDEKNNYISKQNADLLIMGDDWKDKFDHVSCMTKYLPRTQNISTKKYKINIHHAGGGYDGKTYTNSYEAILNSKYMTIEVDVVNIKDCCVIAHDYCEKSFYNYDGKFCDISYQDYKKLKVHNKYTPMDFTLLKQIMSLKPEVNFVLDIKGTDEEYKKSIEFITNIMGDKIKNLIPQIYNYTNFKLCNSLGYSKCLFATYKIIFGKPKEIINSDKVLDVLKKIDNDSIDTSLFGISIHIDYYGTSEFKFFLKKIKHKIYFHGQHAKDEKMLVEKINQEGFGIFIHDV